VNTTFTRPAARSRRAAVRSSIGLSPQIATAGIPTERNCSAMKRACPMDTQNPRALTLRGSPVFRRSSSTTRLAQAWSAVRTFVRAVGSYPAPRFHGTSLRSVPSCTPKYENGTRYCWSIASHTRSSAAMRPSKYRRTSRPSARSGVAVIPRSSRRHYAL